MISMTPTIICVECGDETPRTAPTLLRCPACRPVALRRQKAESYARTAELQKVRRRARYVLQRDSELAYQRRRNYGLSDETLRALLVQQDGRCPICIEPLLWPNVAVDHDHETGKVRGLLHGPCNSGMGLLRDDAVRCERAAAYLRDTASR